MADESVSQPLRSTLEPPTSAEPTLVSVPIGTDGFVSFAHELERLGVLNHAELLGLLEPHGHVLRPVEPPIGENEQSFAQVAAQFMEVVPTVFSYFDRLAEEAERAREEKP